MRSRPGSEVATWSALVGQKRRRDMGGSVGGHDMDFWSRDLEGPLWAETVSRHEIDVAT